MAHARIDNRTPFAFEALLLTDEEFRPLLTPLVKGTFTIDEGGRCTPAEEQLPISASGECYGEDPEKSSFKYEPEVAFFKPATDVVLVGHACAPRSNTTEMQVGLSVGPVRSTALVFGDRVWFKAAGGPAISRPIPFDRMPLVYERAFGGYDRVHPDAQRHAYEPRNPVGTGFRQEFAEDVRLPNIEDPAALIRAFTDRPSPKGFGFVSPHWQPRAALAGTYDAAWAENRAPLLPTNFDRRHLNSASAGLTAHGYLAGNEPVTAMGVDRRGTFAFTLPGIQPPAVRVVRRDDPEVVLQTRLDTVIIEPDERRLQLFWRAMLTLRDGPHDLEIIEVTSDLPS